MGQYWELINLDKKETARCSGSKLGEMFFTSYPLHWIFFLAVPTKKPETDLTAGQVEYGSWAGDHIILLGDYAERLPEGIFTPHKHEKTGVALEDASDSEEDVNEDEDIFQNVLNSCKSVNIADFPPSEDIFPADKVWVLRNLTKKEYVRADGMPTLKNRKEKELEYLGDGSLMGYVGLAHVLPSRLGWSQDPSASLCLSDEMNYHEGLWAGDRLDARLYEDVQAEISGENWKDVSAREAERIDAFGRLTDNVSITKFYHNGSST